MDEAFALVELPDPEDPVGLRDRAALELAYSSGLRVGELCGLDMDDLDLEQRLVRVLGKGGKERVVPVGGKAVQALGEYIKVRHLLGGPEKNIRYASPVFGTPGRSDERPRFSASGR